MNKGLLDVATVLIGDGTWTYSEESDSFSCGRVVDAVGICAPGVIPAVTDSLTGFKIEPFGLYGAQQFGNRCGPDDYMPTMAKVLDDASEYLITKVFWAGASEVLGTWDGNVFLTSTEVATVAPGADDTATLAAVLDAAYSRHPEIKPVVHLGWVTAMKLGAGLKNIDIDYVVGPGYPASAIAVTGPITIRLGSVEATENYTSRNNRFVVEATRLASIDFDVCLAVRAS